MKVRAPRLRTPSELSAPARWQHVAKLQGCQTANVSMTPTVLHHMHKSSQQKNVSPEVAHSEIRGCLTEMCDGGNTPRILEYQQTNRH